MIGVHTPEFAFEHDLENVRHAVRRMKIEYPIAIDNDYSIWRAFNNQYWPALYFIDARGPRSAASVRRGRVRESEKSIQRLLAEAGAAGIGAGVVSVDGRGIEAAADWGNCGLRRTTWATNARRISRRLAVPRRDRRRDYAAPARLALNNGR